MWVSSDGYNAQAAKDFEDETPDPFQPARDALQFARDTSGAWQPAQWAQDAADFAASTVSGMGDVQRAGQPEQQAEPAWQPPEQPQPVQQPQQQAWQPPEQQAGALSSIPTTAAISNPSQGQGSPSMGLG